MIIRCLLLLALGFSTWVMVVDYIQLQSLPADFATRGDARDVFEDLRAYQPWGGYAVREAARIAGEVGPQRPALADAVLSEALAHYPVAAEYWLDRTRITLRRPGGRERLEADLWAAVETRPGDRPLRWRVAMLAAQAGREDLAETHLRQWLDGNPGGVDRALFTAGRWIPGPDKLVERILPDTRAHNRRALEYARVAGREDLAAAVWARVDDISGPDDPLLLARTDQLLSAGRGMDAARAWTRAGTDYRPGTFPDGDFSRSLGPPRGLNWRDREGAGYRIERTDAVSASPPGALEIAFDGSTNVDMNAWLWLPLAPGRQYRLQGQWQAEGLTTRALPRIRIRARGVGVLATLEVPGSTFDWQPWALYFEVPGSLDLVRVMIEREPTDDFDRNIAGRFRLDRLSLEAVPAPPAAATGKRDPEDR